MRALPKITVLATIALVSGCRQSAPDAQSGSARRATGDFEVGTAPAPTDNPKELGWVRWHRNYDLAAAEAKRTGKPIFLLFQEVPGCATCVGFGESVLSHPLLIEAIETEFVPLAIHNNASGHDAAVLERFEEPSWNNPVVRLVDAGGKDLISRASGVWSTNGIAVRMVKALAAADRPIPEYLSWVVEETTPRADRATFSMHCYWTGEACLGDIPGVVHTTAGWLDGREVVEVEFDPSRLSEADLRELAAERSCGHFVAKAAPARPASDSDRKYHLGHSRWRFVPLTPLQASRVNAALGRRDDPTRWVSPRQRTLYQRITRADATTFDGLTRPDTLRDLASYQQEVVTRLGM